MTNQFSLPTTLTAPLIADQFGAERLAEDSKIQPVDGVGQATTRSLLFGGMKIRIGGAPGLCTAKGAQNPPVTE